MLGMEKLEKWVHEGHAIPWSEFNEVFGSGLEGYHPQGTEDQHKEYKVRTQAGVNYIWMELSGEWDPRVVAKVAKLKFYLRRWRFDHTSNQPPSSVPRPPVDIPTGNEYYYLESEDRFTIDGFNMVRWEIHPIEVRGAMVFKDYIYWNKQGFSHHDTDDLSVRTSWRWIHS